MLAISPRLWYNSQADYFEFLTSLLGGASIMAKCECCGKGVTFGIKVSHSHRRSNRTWKPNVRRVKAVVEGSPKSTHAPVACALAKLPALSKLMHVAGHFVEWPAFLL